MAKEKPDKEKNCNTTTLLVVPQFALEYALELVKQDCPSAEITIEPLMPSK